MKGAHTNLYTCRAVCSNFSKGDGGGGGKLGVLGASGGALEDNIKKIVR